MAVHDLLGQHLQKLEERWHERRDLSELGDHVLYRVLPLRDLESVRGERKT